MAQKIGEEGVELAIALVQGERTDIIGESADLLFHLLIALEDADISFTEVLEALAQREGTSGIEEKRARGG